MACFQITDRTEQGCPFHGQPALPHRFKVGFKASRNVAYSITLASYYPLRLDYLNQSDYAL